MGFTIDTEIMTIDGRIDAVITTKDNIYILEFKVNQDANTALQQIKDKGYHKKYAAESKPITLIGIDFDMKEKKIKEYLME